MRPTRRRKNNGSPSPTVLTNKFILKPLSGTLRILAFINIFLSVHIQQILSKILVNEAQKVKHTLDLNLFYTSISLKQHYPSNVYLQNAGRWRWSNRGDSLIWLLFGINLLKRRRRRLTRRREDNKLTILKRFDNRR